jgi:hypothetical protein
VKTDLDLPTNKTLFVGWHFPEYPLLMNYGARSNVLVLIARLTVWMKDFEPSGCLFNFREAPSAKPLVQAFRSGRCVFAMMDHCYPETASVRSRLLDHPVRTPSGALKLAERFGYDVCFLSPRSSGIKVIDTFPARELGVEGSAQRINDVLGREILRDPARWLMWINLPGRVASAFD